jgi:predicted Zn-dependent protease
VIESLLKLLEAGQDSALLRFGLGSAYLKRDQPRKAVEHLEAAVRMDPEHSASWKLYGKALALTGESEQAARAYTDGIEVADRRGDVQGAKEMRVFLRRLQKARRE